jgi:hypothetical protein
MSPVISILDRIKNKGQEMKIPWKERVRADLIKRNDKYRGSGSWLNKALPFNHSLRLSKDQKEKKITST